VQSNGPGLGWLFATLLLQRPNHSQQAASGVRRVMLSSCDVTQGVGGSGDSKGGPGWAMATPDFCLAPCLALSFFFHNFPFKFVWLTYTVENFRPAIL